MRWKQWDYAPKKKINFRTPLKSIRIHIPTTLPHRRDPENSTVTARTGPRAHGRYTRLLRATIVVVDRGAVVPLRAICSEGLTKFKAATKLKISNRRRQRRQRRRRRRDELFGAAAAADASRAPQRNDGTPSQGTSWIEADEFQRAVLRWQNERSSSAGGPS